MIDVEQSVLNCSIQKKCCAQTMVSIGLEARGEENKQMVSAVRGLCFGLQRQCDCGALTGAACMLGLWDEEYTIPMVQELVDWFVDSYGSTVCADLIGEGNRDKSKCLNIMIGTAQKCFELLEDNDLLED